MARIKQSATLTGLFPASVTDARETVRGIEESARLGYEAAEFFYDGPGNGEVARACRDAGIATIYHPAYALKQQKLDLGDPVEERRRQAVDRVRGWIDRAAGFGSQAVMLLSGPERSEAGDRTRAVGLLSESLETLCDHARGAGAMRVHLESFNNLGEPWLLMGPTARCREMAAAVAARHANFGLTFDLSHALQMGEDPLASLLSIRPYCSHVHLANCVIRDRGHPLFGDKHPPFGLAGSEVDTAWLGRFVRSLTFGGFFEGRTVTVGAEVITRPPAAPVATATEAKRALDEALAGLEEERR